MPSPEDIEEEIASLPRGAVKDSIRVFAGWMRANREALQSQIAGLQIRFEEINKEDKRRLDEIVDQTRKTNGRVTDLENAARLDHALTDAHGEWESQQEATDRRAVEHRSARLDKRRDRLMSAGLIVFGALIAGVAKKLGIA